jgi:hypothetical protein
MSVTPPVFTIEAEQIPSKSFSVSFREPLFEDRIAALRAAGTDEKNGTVQELLLSLCLTAINGNPLNVVPRDPMGYYRDMQHLDAQFLLGVFTSMFYLQKEMGDQARQTGMQFKLAISQSYTIPAADTPSGSHSITFRNPTLGDRIRLEKVYPGNNSDCGYYLDELLFAGSLAAVDGAPVQTTRDLISTISKWRFLDVQYALTVFINTVTLDDTDAKNVVDLGKSLWASVKDSRPTSKSSSKSKSSEPTPTT